MRFILFLLPFASLFGCIYLITKAKNRSIVASFGVFSAAYTIYSAYIISSTNSDSANAVTIFMLMLFYVSPISAFVGSCAGLLTGALFASRTKYGALVNLMGLVVGALYLLSLHYFSEPIGRWFERNLWSLVVMLIGIPFSMLLGAFLGWLMALLWLDKKMRFKAE